MTFKTRARVDRRMNHLAEEIVRSMQEQPDAYDERERLWIEREELRAWTIEAARRPSLAMRVGLDMFGPRPMTVGAGVAAFFVNCIHNGGGWHH